MNKQEFLNKLSSELIEIKDEEKKDILDYYDELITDAIESGKNEIEFISSLGTIDSIIKKAEIERKVKKLNEKPTTHNSLSVLIAVLGAITSPILIPLAFAVVLVIFSLILAGACVVFALGLSVIALFIAFLVSFGFLFTSPLAIILPIAILGALLIVTGLTVIIGKFIFSTVIVGIVNLFKNIVFKRGDKKNV